MNQLLSAALAYAPRGWRVFPVHGIQNGRCSCGRPDCSSPGKHPLVGRGLRDASTEEGVIRAWWKHWRLANAAIATGGASGVIVVDIDVPEGERSLELVEAMGLRLPTTLTARTGSGGRHLYYAAPQHHLGNTVGSLPGIDRELPGIDLRAEGGYVLAPPSLHISGTRYIWLDASVPIAPAPGWLKEAPRVIAPMPPAGKFTGAGTAYGRAVLDSAMASLRCAPVGQRNNTLNRCAFAVGRYVAAEHLSESVARAELTRVGLSIGLTQSETERTIDSAFSAVGGGIR